MSFAVKVKKSIIIVSVLIGTVAVFICSDTLRAGVKSALSLCAGSVIPSLFLFTAITLFIAKSYVGRTLGKALSLIFKPTLGLNAEEATVFLLSAVAGYPVGAKLLDSLYCDGKISRAHAFKMLTFSVNAGPAFIVTAVGGGILISEGDGWRLLIIHLAATLILGIVMRFVPENRLGSKGATKKLATASDDESNLINIFVLSVAEAGQTMLSICIFVVFFGTLGSALATAPFHYSRAAGAVVEVTAGLHSFTRQDLPKIAFLLGFGGISVIFQVLSTAKTIRPPLWLIFSSRILHGVISALITVFAEKVFPRSLTTGVFNVQPQAPVFYQTPLAGLSLIFLFIITAAFFQNTKDGILNRR